MLESRDDIQANVNGDADGSKWAVPKFAITSVELLEQIHSLAS